MSGLAKPGRTPALVTAGRLREGSPGIACIAGWGGRCHQPLQRRFWGRCQLSRLRGAGDIPPSVFGSRKLSIAGPRKSEWEGSGAKTATRVPNNLNIIHRPLGRVLCLYPGGWQHGDNWSEKPYRCQRLLKHSTRKTLMKMEITLLPLRFESTRNE